MVEKISAALMLLEYWMDGYEDERLVLAAFEFAQSAIIHGSEISDESQALVDGLIEKGAREMRLKGCDRVFGEMVIAEVLH